MEKQENDSIQTFDTLYTTNQIQIMKLILPFCSQEQRRSLVVMIKFMELQYTITFTRAHPECFLEPALPFALNDICDKIRNYCPPQLRSMLDQFQSMQNALKMYEEMKQMMELFQGEGAPDADVLSAMMGGSAQNAAHSDESGSPMDLLMGFLDPGQQELFQMFQSGFGTQAAESPPNSNQGENEPDAANTTEKED